MIDLDFFKLINDELGHLAGDRVLAEVGALLRANVRDIDVPGRWGGEEFLIVCPETDAESALKVAERIVAVIAGHGFSSKRPQTASAGVAALADGDEPDGLLSRADAALY
nr:GGDEF domain-containing protein [Fundidesulfovibrio soli]